MYTGLVFKHIVNMKVKVNVCVRTAGGHHGHHDRRRRGRALHEHCGHHAEHQRHDRVLEQRAFRERAACATRTQRQRYSCGSKALKCAKCDKRVFRQVRTPAVLPAMSRNAELRNSSEQMNV